MMTERGIKIDHTTIMTWVHQYSPKIEKKIRKHLRPTNDSWRVDETYIKVKGKEDIHHLQSTVCPPPLKSRFLKSLSGKDR
jgi:transposase-like protein